MHLDLLLGEHVGIGRQVGSQILGGHAVLCQLGHAYAAEVEVIEPLLLRVVPRVPLRRGCLRDRVAVLHLVLAVDHERDVVGRRHLGRETLLAEDERLERMQEVLEGQARQRPMHPAVGRTEEIVEAGMEPRLEVSPAHLGIDVRRPRDGERIHPVLVLEDVRGVDGVLASAARHQHVIAAVGAPVAREHIAQLPLALGPVGPGIFPFREAARVAHPVGAEVDRLLLRFRGVLVLDGRGGPLVGDHAPRAEAHLARQAEFRLERWRRAHASAPRRRGRRRSRIARPTRPLFSGWN